MQLRDDDLHRDGVYVRLNVDTTRLRPRLQHNERLVSEERTAASILLHCATSGMASLTKTGQPAQRARTPSCKGNVQRKGKGKRRNARKGAIQYTCWFFVALPRRR